MQQRNRGKDLLTLAEKSHYNKTMGDADRTPEVKKWGDAPRNNNSSQIYYKTHRPKIGYNLI